MKALILASESPRRRDLLNQAGFSFSIFPAKVSEIPDKNLNINEQILDIARRKARAVLAELKSLRHDDFIILSADTEVIYDGAPLGKPQSREDAFRILRLLSGTSHEVKTAVCMIDSLTLKEVSHIETTLIFFKNLSNEDIWTYIETGEPMDKAGAYGIQGLGGKFVEKYEGAFDNVVGLPVQAVRELLARINTTDLPTFIAECSPAQVLAVSKLQPLDKIRHLYSAGQRHFGENYVQEALDKVEQLQDLTDIKWHFIGHLQKNKIKYILGKFSLIHSIDSLELAQTLSKSCVAKNTQQRVLLQVNLSHEETKGGFDKTLLKQQWPLLCDLPGLSLCGLMTMPPLSMTGEEVRPYFQELKELLMSLKENTDLTKHPMNELSMGTSHDYKVAIQEGATIVRLGTILFGERPAKG